MKRFLCRILGRHQLLLDREKISYTGQAQYQCQLCGYRWPEIKEQ